MPSGGDPVPSGNSQKLTEKKLDCRVENEKRLTQKEGMSLDGGVWKLYPHTRRVNHEGWDTQNSIFPGASTGETAPMADGQFRWIPFGGEGTSWGNFPLLQGQKQEEQVARKFDFSWTNADGVEWQYVLTPCKLKKKKCKECAGNFRTIPNGRDPISEK